jgi:hypothetical protein
LARAHGSAPQQPRGGRHEFHPDGRNRIETRDLNRNSNWDPGETNLDLNGADFIESTGHEFAAIAPNFVPNPDEKQVMYEKQVQVPRGQLATVTLNIYSALNANTVTGLQNRSGPDFLQPLSILPPRLAEISLAYRF